MGVAGRCKAWMEDGRGRTGEGKAGEGEERGKSLNWDLILVVVSCSYFKRLSPLVKTLQLMGTALALVDARWVSFRILLFLQLLPT